MKNMVIPFKTYFIVVSILLLTISCSKTNSNNTNSTKHTLLLSTWNFKSTTFIQIGGPGLFRFIPTVPTTYDFNSAGIFTIQPSSPLISYPYTLLADDSTLIFNTNPGGTPVYDTNFITLINSNNLVYHGFNPPGTFVTIDSLYR